MLDALLKEFTEDQFAEYGALQLSQATFNDNAVQLQLNVRRGTEKEDWHIWQIDSVGMQSHRLVLGPCLALEVVEDHVLLWPYTKPSTALSFKGTAANASAVVGALYQRHNELCEPWLPMSQFTSSLLPLADLLELDEGMIAQGPEPLMQAYAEVLEQFGLQATLLPSEEQAEAMSDVRALVLGYSWIVAHSFAAKKLDTAE